jgi:ABC-2 type transport system permease protein
MTALSAPYSERIWPTVWKLVRLRLLITWNSFKHAKVVRKIFTVIGYLLLLAFGIGICIGSWLLLKFLRSPQLVQYTGVDVGPFLQSVPILIFTLLFFSILLTSFGVLLQALYLSGDMDFLLAAPVSLRAVFVAKLLQAVLPNFSLLALFGLPVLYGLGFSEHYNILYYPLVLVVMVALTLAAAGISALLVMLVVRVLPPRRAAEILGFIGATLGLLCGQAGNLFNSFGRNTDISGTQVAGAFGTLTRFNTLWLPFAWPGRGLMELGGGNWLIGLLLVAVSLGGCALVFGLALVTAERWYYTGWAGMQVVTRRKKTVRTRRPATTAVAIGAAVSPRVSTPLLQRILPAPVWAIVQKDYLLYRRDLRNLSQLISPLILGVIYTLIIFRTGGTPPAGQGQAPELIMGSLQILLAYSSVGMSLFVGWMLLGRLSGMAFSAEGKNFWLLKASPLRAIHLLEAKFLVAYIPTFLLGLFFLVGIAVVQKMPLVSFLYSLLALVMCLAGMNGILLGFGAAGAKFDWDDPRKMNAGTMGCLGQVVTMVFVPLAFGLFIGPLWLTSAFNLPPIFGYLVGGGVGVIVTVVATLLPPWLALKKVEHLGEN